MVVCEFHILKRLVDTEGFGMSVILARQAKTVETIRHKVAQYFLGCNETMESQMIEVFGKVENRDGVGLFDVVIELFIVLSLHGGLTTSAIGSNVGDDESRRWY